MSFRSVSRASLVFLVASLLSGLAQAQLFRAYLDPRGNDANPCTLAAPCRLLPAALNAVSSGGEVWMLDSANYNTGTVTIDKSVTILAVPGAVGSFVAASGGPAMQITAASLTVALRNVVVVPLTTAPGTSGVHMTSASSLTIENSLFANLPGPAIYVLGPGKLDVLNTTIRNGSDYAVKIENGGSATVTGSKMLNNLGGVHVRTSASSTDSKAAVSDSLISGGREGVYAFADPAFPNSVSVIYVTRSTIQGTVNALHSEATDSVAVADVDVSASMVTNNTNGWYQFGRGANVRSLGNNHLLDNGTNVGILSTVALR